MAREERAEISILFFQNSTLLQVWAFDVFHFLDNTLGAGVFTLIKLVFETQAAKLWQRGVMDRGKKCLGAFVKTWLQFFSSLLYILRKDLCPGPMKPGVMTFI